MRTGLQANMDGMIIVSNYSGEFRKMKMEFKTKKKYPISTVCAHLNNVDLYKSFDTKIQLMSYEYRFSKFKLCANQIESVANH